jgi:hypothetical protein
MQEKRPQLKCIGDAAINDKKASRQHEPLKTFEHGRYDRVSRTVLMSNDQRSQSPNRGGPWIVPSHKFDRKKPESTTMS